MRCNPWRWIWGLIPIVGIAWVAAQVEHARIERDLTTRGKEELARLGLGWADLSFSGRDGTLSGRAAEESEAGRAVAAALQTWGVRTVIDNSGLIDKVDRYEWTAMRRDNRIRLNGLVPNEKTRRDVIGIVKASFPNLEIEDRLRLARGAPPADTWLGGVGFGIKQLAHLRNGQIDLEVTTLSVSGEAIDAQAYRAVKTALAQALPPGIKLKLDRVTGPVVKPYVWSAKLVREQLLLSGYVPNDGLRQDILSAARDGNAKIRIVDNMNIAEGAPEGWLDAVTAAVQGLAELEEGSADMRDAAMTFAGLAESEAKADAVRDQLRRMPAAFKVTEQLRARPPAIPVISPYATSAVLEADGLSLAGHVPNENERQALLARVRERLQGVNVRDGLQVGAGQPASWQKCIQAGLDGLARAGRGRAELIDARLELSVSTMADDVARSLPEEIRQSAGSDCEAIVHVAYVAPPEPALKWLATHKADQLVLSGEVPGEDAHAELVRAAGRLFAGIRLDDKMTVVPQKSEKWTRAAYEGLVLLSRLRHGELALIDRELTLSGEAAEAGVQSAVNDAMAQNMPEGYRGQAQIVVRADPPAALRAQETTSSILPKRPADDARPKAEVDACQALLGTAARTGIIHFERDSAELRAESIPTLKRLVEVANNCSGVRFEIAGHTDADGRPEHNQALSEQRARTIAEFLARSGVDRERMKAVGYGESRPLVPNDTASHKAENRRIEFTVKVD
ncbi:MAG: OmpA family protein [Bacteroidota bacterium]